MKKIIFCVSALGLVTLFFAPAEGSAQEDPSAEVMSLNQKAMSDYQNMKIPEALEKLQEAEITCLQSGLLGHEIALTYLNMGLIEAAGNQNEAAASDFFLRAICSESSIALDPLISTPEVEALFAGAATKASSPGTCEQIDIGGLEPPPPDAAVGSFAAPDVPPPPPVASTGGPVPQSDNIRHTPVGEQVKMTPVPLFIQVQPGTPSDSVILFYRTYGERNYQQFVMAPMGDGFGVEIGCSVLQTFDPTAIEYYIGVMDSTGMVVGFSGNEAQPHIVNFVQSLNGPAPALPGAAAPAKCMTECPPWNPDCNSGGCKQYGDLCDRNSDCCKGMVCVNQTCTPGEGDDDDDDDLGPFKPHFRMGFTFGTGGGFVSSGYAVPDNRVAAPPYSVWIKQSANIENCRGAGYSESNFDECYKKKVEGLNIDGGMAWAKFQFRLSPTFYLTEKMMIGLVFRGGLPLASGDGVLPVTPLGLVTFGYRLVGSGKDRFELTALVGLGGGIMYHKLSYDDCNPIWPAEGHPWYGEDADGIVCDASQINTATSEWYGPSDASSYYKQTYFRKAGYFAGEIGMDMYFWVIKNFGINLGVAVDFLAAPDFAANADVQAGVAMRF